MTDYVTCTLPRVARGRILSVVEAQQHILPFPTPANDGHPLPRPGERAIRARVGARNFDKAIAYHAWGAVHRGRIEGSSLFARCEGSGHEVWRVRVALDSAGVRGAHCSCPVGEDGTCKHVAATLLAWAHRPEEFVPTGTLTQAVERLSLTQLRSLVVRLLAVDPTLEDTVERLLPESLDAHRPPPARPTWRWQVGELFRRHGAHLDAAAATAVTHALRALRSDALRRIGPDDHGALATLHAQMAEGILGRWRRLGDESSAALELARQCVRDLGACVAAMGPAHPARTASLRALLTLYRFDIEAGPAAWATGGAPGLLALRQVVAHATPDERRQLAVQVGERIERAEGWTRHAWSRCRLELEEGLVDDADWLDACAASMRHGLAARRLAALGRGAEAVQQLAAAAPSELVETADALTSAGLGAKAEACLAARAESLPEAWRPSVAAWLKGRAAARRDVDAALEVDLSMFRAMPSREGYDALRQRATALGCWDALRPRVLDTLAERAHPLRVEVLLEEGALEAAAEASADPRARNQRHTALRMQLLDALEAALPAQALGLLEIQAEALVAQRGRAAYRDACRALARHRTLAEAAGTPEVSQALVEAFRARHARLGALQEELALAFGPAPAAVP